MNWRKTKVFNSFSILGALIESVYDSSSKQLILYDTQEIKIYGVSNGEVRMHDKIRLYTQIKKVVFLSSQSKYLIVQNAQGQISAISPIYPYEHKLIYLPENFTDANLTCSQNRSSFIVQYQNEIQIYELNQKQEFFSHQISIKFKEIKQIDVTFDDTLHIMCQSYEPIVDNQMFANIETTIYYSKLHYKEKGLQSYHFKFVILQMIAMEMDDLIILTQNDIQCIKSGKTHLAIPVQLQNLNAFMRFNPVNNQLFLCNQTYIDIVEIRFDDFNQIQSMVRVQTLQLSVFNVVIGGDLVWIQTENSSTINQMNNIKHPSIQDLDIQTKKVKLEDQELLFKTIGTFYTYNRIFNFTVVANSLYILYGNAAQSQVLKVQHELTPLITTISLKIKQGINEHGSPLIFENHIGFVNDLKQLSLFKILKDGSFQLVDNITIPEFQEIITNGTVNNNCFYIQFDTYLWFIQTNPLSQFSRQFDCREVKQQINYFIGYDEQNNLIATYLKEKSLIYKQIYSNNITTFDIAQQDNDLFVLVLERAQLSIFKLAVSGLEIQISLIFLTHDFMNNINCLLNRAEYYSCQNYASTCPSVPIKIQNNENQEIKSAYLINFMKSKSLIVILISSIGKVSIYSLIKDNTEQITRFKLIFSYTSNSEQILPQKIYVMPNQIIIPTLNLTLTDNLGEIMIHFIKQEERYEQVILMQQNAFIIGKSGSCYSFPILQRSNLPCNNIIVYPVLKDKSSAIMMHSFQFNSHEYLLVINKANRRTNQNQQKNEVLVYRADNLNDPFAQYDQLDNEEIIKVQFLPGMDLILIMTILMQQQMSRDYPNTKLHILKLDQYQKITEQQQSRLIKESIPCDFVIMAPKLVLLFMQDQMKYIDLNCGQSAINFQLTPDSSKIEQVQIQIEAVAIVDRWIAVLNGGFKVVICKFEEDNSQPKVDWATEFGVDKIIDIQLLKTQYQKPLLVLLDADHNLSIYSITYKTKIKKIADCSVVNPCRMLNISNKLIISSNDGSMTMFDQIDDEQSANKFKTMIQELPYIGGFQPSNLYFFKQPNGKGFVWDMEMLDVFNTLSSGVEKVVDRHSYNPFI